MLGKLLGWMTHIESPGHRQLRFPTQHDMPMLPLDRNVHWPSIRGDAESGAGSLAPSNMTNLSDHGHDPDDANGGMADHATVIHTALADPEFAGDFSRHGKPVQHIPIHPLQAFGLVRSPSYSSMMRN